jgi:hypothetical protein
MPRREVHHGCEQIGQNESEYKGKGNIRKYVKKGSDTN